MNRRQPPRPWTPGETAALRRLAARGLSLRAIGERMGRDNRLIAERAKRHGIEVRRVISPRYRWTPASDARLRELFADFSAGEIAERVGCCAASVHRRAQALGLRKSSGWKSERTARLWLQGNQAAMRSGCFKAGQAPWNKGKPGSTGKHPNCVRNQFKEGVMAGAAREKYMPIGSLRITKDDQLQRKVTDDPRITPPQRWVAVARLVWQATHGPIPRGHVVRFKDGMHSVIESEITSDRLECISKVENMARNTLHRYPKEIATLVQLRGALNRKINNRIREASTQ